MPASKSKSRAPPEKLTPARAGLKIQAALPVRDETDRHRGHAASPDRGKASPHYSPDVQNAEPTTMAQEHGGGSIESILNETRVFPPSADFARKAHISSLEQYQSLWNWAKEDPEG